MNKNTFIIGFMLFSLFFGAGNLIYSPTFKNGGLNRLIFNAYFVTRYSRLKC